MTAKIKLTFAQRLALYAAHTHGLRRPNAVRVAAKWWANSRPYAHASILALHRHGMITVTDDVAKPTQAGRAFLVEWYGELP